MATTENPFRREPRREHVDKVKGMYPLARAEFSAKGLYWFVHVPVHRDGYYAGPSATSPAQAWEYAAEDIT